ncbi:MAG: hypothetical protein ACXWZS_10485 [Gemmatirosa sp.]
MGAKGLAPAAPGLYGVRTLLRLGVNQLPVTVDRNQRFGLLLIALSVVAFTAHSTHAGLLIDACLDAGGRYLSAPPRCDLGGAAAGALSRVPQRDGAWLIALVPASLAGALVYLIGGAALRRVARRR